MSSLTFVYGCMNTSKTSLLLMRHHACEENKQNPIILKPTTDIREGRFNHLEYGTIKSRLINSGTKALYLDVKKFKESEEHLRGKNIVFVDEAQFLSKEDVWYLSDLADYFEKEVVAFGLKNNAEGELFEGSAALITMADNLEECYGVCKCGKKATHNVRLTGGVGLVGEAGIESENVRYESVCRECFKRYMERIEENVENNSQTADCQLNGVSYKACCRRCFKKVMAGS